MGGGVSTSVSASCVHVTGEFPFVILELLVRQDSRGRLSCYLSPPENCCDNFKMMERHF